VFYRWIAVGTCLWHLHLSGVVQCLTHIPLAYFSCSR